jgi:hypothetical protein
MLSIFYCVSLLTFINLKDTFVTYSQTCNISSYSYKLLNPSSF